MLIIYDLACLLLSPLLWGCDFSLHLTLLWILDRHPGPASPLLLHLTQETCLSPLHSEPMLSYLHMVTAMSSVLSWLRGLQLASHLKNCKNSPMLRSLSLLRKPRKIWFSSLFSPGLCVCVCVCVCVCERERDRDRDRDRETETERESVLEEWKTGKGN